MKPEDFVPSFKREERRTCIYDRVFFVPLTLHNQPKSDFVFPGWEHPDLFGNTNPVYIEYCSGNGAWIADRAAKNPNINWVGVERKFDRVRKLWSKVKNHKLNNMIVLCGEALNATQLYFPTNSVQAVYINFPDPWPKNRHAKNRLIQPSFTNEIWRILQADCPLTFVTDDPPYSAWFIEEIQAQKGFASKYPDPFYVTNIDGYGESYFEQLWRSKGRTIYTHEFKKIEHKR